MNEKNKRKVSFLSGIISALIFLFLVFVLKWSFWLSVVISFLLLIALSLLLKPSKKIGETPIEELAQGERLSKIYSEAQKNIEEIEGASKKIKNKDLQKKLLELEAIGQDILKYLSKNPELLSRSEHFLSYYLTTANRILTNYLQLQESHVSTEKWMKVEESSQESMDYLIQIFSKQRDSYHKNTIMDLEAESELLEKTISLGGDE